MASTGTVSGTRDLSRAVAAEIRAQLGREDITRVELARRLQVDNTWVGKRLNGQTEIGLMDLQRIADALGVSVVDLLPREVTERYPTDPIDAMLGLAPFVPPVSEMPIARVAATPVPSLAASLQPRRLPIQVQPDRRLRASQTAPVAATPVLRRPTPTRSPIG